MSAADSIREDLERYPDAKYGFVVYRCTYGDDKKWDRFMEYLNAQARARLEEEEVGYLWERLDWNVQQDPSLDEANEEEVRRRFRKWIDEGSEIDHATPRHRACVMVRSAQLESVSVWLDEGEAMDEPDMFGVSWVYLVSIFDEYHEPPDEDDVGGEEEKKEKKKPRDAVSLTGVGISYLVPRVYELLDAAGWTSFADPEGGIVTP